MGGHRKRTRDDPPRWVEIFLAHEASRQAPRWLGRWLRSRPRPVQALLRHFPPHIVIRVPATETRPRAFALIRGYDRAGRYLRVALHAWDTAERWQRIRPDGAEFFGAWRGVTPERVVELLDEEE